MQQNLVQSGDSSSSSRAVLHYIIHLDVSRKEHPIMFECLCKEGNTRTHTHARAQTQRRALSVPHDSFKARWCGVSVSDERRNEKKNTSEPKCICCYAALTSLKCLIRAGADKTAHSLANVGFPFFSFVVPYFK